MTMHTIENNKNKKRKLDNIDDNDNIIKNTSKLDNSIGVLCKLQTPPEIMHKLPISGEINDLQIFIERPKLIKNNYVDGFPEKNPLALMMPDDNIFNTEIKLTEKNTCNCSFMKDLYDWFGKNIEPVEIKCTHNKNI